MNPSCLRPRERTRRRFFSSVALGSLFLVVVLAASGSGASAQGDGVGEEANGRLEGLAMPVQTVVDAFPRFVEEAIVEAEFDGTPDRAEALLSEMEAYVAQFSRPHAWPRGSVADSVAYQEALWFAADVVALSQLVPSVASRVEIVRASCAAFESANANEAQSWLRDTRAARVDYGVLIAGLLDVTRQLPVMVDKTPLDEGFKRLQMWGNTSLVAALQCSEEAAVFFDVYEPDDHLAFFVRPATAWPTADVQFFGAVGRDTDAREVVLSGPGLGLDREMTVGANGGFHVRHVVPLETALEAHEVHARAAGHEETVTVTIARAPVTLVVDHPERVAPGQTFSLHVRLLDPLEGTPEGGVVTASGDLEGVIDLVDRRGLLQWTAPDAPGLLQGEVAYEGDALRAPAQGSYHVLVQEDPVTGVAPDAADVRLELPEEDPDTGVAPGSDAPGEGQFFGLERNLVQSVLIVLAFLLVAFFLLLSGLRLWQSRSRRGHAPAGVGSQGAHPAAMTGALGGALGGSFIMVYAAFYDWCVRLGWVGPGATARDMTRRLGSPQPLRRATAEFERVRYGGGREQPERSRGALAATLSAWRAGIKRRVKKKPGA